MIAEHPLLEVGGGGGGRGPTLLRTPPPICRPTRNLDSASTTNRHMAVPHPPGGLFAHLGDAVLVEDADEEVSDSRACSERGWQERARVRPWPNLVGLGLFEAGLDRSSLRSHCALMLRTTMELVLDFLPHLLCPVAHSPSLSTLLGDSLARALIPDHAPLHRPH